MSVPKDQGLTLTVFLSVSLFVVLMFWVFLPVHYNPHAEEEHTVQFLEPEKAVVTAQQILKQAEESLTELEKDEEGEEGTGGKEEGADKK